MATEHLISADSHVNPPKDLWTRDAPERLEDRVPRVESTPQGDFGSSTRRSPAASASTRPPAARRSSSRP